MSHPSESGDPSPVRPFWREGSEQQPALPPHSVGLALFEKTFDFYAWYLSYDLTPSKHYLVFESLSLLMQIAKLSFEQGSIITAEEELKVLRALHDLSEALSNGMLKSKDLSPSLDTIVKKLTDANAKTRLIAALIKLEYKICFHSEVLFDEMSQMTFKKLIQDACQRISASLPDLIASTLARELESLLKQSLTPDHLLKEFHNALALLRHE